MVGAGPQAASSGAGERGAGALPGWRTGCDGVASRAGCVRWAWRGVAAGRLGGGTGGAGRGVAGVRLVAGPGRSYVRSGAVNGGAVSWWVAGTVAWCVGTAFAWRACRINCSVEGSGVDGPALSLPGATIGSTTGARVSPMGSVTGERTSAMGSTAEPTESVTGATVSRTGSSTGST